MNAVLEAVHVSGIQIALRTVGAIAVALCSCSTWAASLALENVRVVVGDGRAPIVNATVLIEGERIAQVGARDAVQIPPSAQRIDLAGKTIMPALIDTHVHVNQPRAALINDLKRLAYFGVGTALSLGVDTGDAPFEVKAQPIAGAARLLTAGRGITGPEPGRETAPYWITTSEEAAQAVRENAARNVDMIKVWVDDRRGTVNKLPPDLYAAVIKAAHERELKVSAHIFALSDAKSLLKAQVDAFAHSVRDREVDDEFLALVRERRSLVLNPNLTSRGEPTNLAWLKSVIPPADLTALEQKNVVRTQDQQSFAIQANNLRRMKDAGVRIVLGTDTSFDFPGGNTPWAAHIEMEDMVAAGMTPTEVIAAATATAAEFLGLRNVGTIEAGKVADLLVLDADPLVSITNTRRISAVYLRGEKVDRALYP